MRKNQALIEVLCRPCCAYFKPGRNEELLCRGAVVVERMIRSRTLPADPGGSGGALDAGAVGTAVRRVCGACEFRERDCDFAEDGTSRPCGGFELLVRLLAAELICESDLE